MAKNKKLSSMNVRIITGLVLISVLVGAFTIRMMDQSWSQPVFVGLLSVFCGIALYEAVSVKGKKNDWDLIPYIVVFVLAFVALFVKFEALTDEASNVTWHLSINYNGEPGLSMPHLALFLGLLFPLPVFFKKYTPNDVSFLFMLTVFISLVFGTLFFISEHAPEAIILIIVIAASTDTFAYFGGTFFGKHKLIPRVSPKKTWEGSIIGTACATAAGAILLNVWPETRLNEIAGANAQLFYILIPLGISIASQIGDLVMSAVKRENDIKDFSNIFPGHGGVLDRIDSIAPASIILFVLFRLLA